jgi:uncharacterized membrane protein
MATGKPTSVAGAYFPAQPEIRQIGTPDVLNALSKGFADFMAMPTHLFYLCVIYPAIMLVIVRIFAGYDVLPLVFPLFAGSTLLGPVVATGMYELSRRREMGLDTSRWHAFDPLKFHAIRSIAILGVILLAIFAFWMLIAYGLYLQIFGDTVPDSIPDFIRLVFTTTQGWELIVIGTGVGFLFAIVVLTISVVSFPRLMHKDVGVLAAVQTSIRAVMANPKTTAVWGFIVAVSLLIGALPLFMGLAVVMPVLGHATWHLYRSVVAE